MNFSAKELFVEDIHEIGSKINKESCYLHTQIAIIASTPGNDATARGQLLVGLLPKSKS